MALLSAPYYIFLFVIIAALLETSKTDIVIMEKEKELLFLLI